MFFHKCIPLCSDSSLILERPCYKVQKKLFVFFERIDNLFYDEEKERDDEEK